MRGSINDWAISTKRFKTTKNIANTNMTPCSRGMSLLKIASFSKKPVPGQEKTVSTKIDPPNK